MRPVESPPVRSMETRTRTRPSSASAVDRFSAAGATALSAPVDVAGSGASPSAATESPVASFIPAASSPIARRRTDTANRPVDGTGTPGPTNHGRPRESRSTLMRTQ